MRNKVIALILCVCSLVPLFAIFSFAEGAENAVSEASTNVDYGVPEDLYEMIDVDAYINNAGKEGYDKMKLIGFSAPNIVYYEGSMSSSAYYKVYFEFYIYNPLLYAIPVDPYFECPGPEVDGSTSMPEHAHYDHAIVSSENYFSLIKGTWPAITEFYGDEINSDHFHVYNAMFFGISWACEYYASQYEELCEKDLPLTLNGLKFDIYVGERITDDGNEIYDYFDGLYTGGYTEEKIYEAGYRHCELELNTDICLKDINSMLRFSTAYTDMSTFLDISVDKLNEEYPLKKEYEEKTPAFLYEDAVNNRLYFYAYDSLGKGAIQDNLNKISLSFDGVTYKEYPLRFINFENTLSKFEIVGAFDSSYFGLNERTYYVNSYKYAEMGTVSEIYDIGIARSEDKVKYVYTGTKDNVSVKIESDYIRILDVGNTYYRLNSSANGNHKYQTLSSVYFTIPESYFELDDSDYLNDRWLERIKGQYTSCMTNPGIVTKNKDLYDKFLADGADGNIDNCFLICGNDEKHNSALNGNYYCDFVICDEGYINWQNDNHYYKIYPKNRLGSQMYSAIYYVDSLPSDGALIIDNNDLEISIKNNLNSLDKETEKFVEFDIYKDAVFDMFSIKDSSFSELMQNYDLFDSLLILVGWYDNDLDNSISNINAFEVLDSRINPDTNNSYLYDAIHLEKTEFLSKYLVAESDYDNVIKKMEYALDNNESFVLLRFDKYDYYVNYASEDLWLDNDDTLIFQDKYYSDFELLELELKNQYNSVVYRLDMEPISFIADITMDDSIKFEDSIIEDFLNNIGSRLFGNGDNKFDWKDSVKRILGLILILVLAVVVTKFVLVPIIKAIRKK